MRGSTNPSKQSLGGYLLLEVVLALLLASLLLGGVMAIATGSLQISEVIAEDGRRQMTREAFLTFLGRNLEELPGNAQMQLIREDGGSHYLATLTFQNVPTAFSWSGQAVSAEAVQLVTVKTNNGVDIVLRYYEEPLLDDSDSVAVEDALPVAELILLRDVWRFELWALDGRTMEWTENWDLNDRRPLQLELNVVFHPNGEEIIHYFWIPPKANPELVMRSQQRAAPQQRGGQGGGERGENGGPRGGNDAGGRPNAPQVRPNPGGGSSRPGPPTPGR